MRKLQPILLVLIFLVSLPFLALTQAVPPNATKIPATLPAPGVTSSPAIAGQGSSPTDEIPVKPATSPQSVSAAGTSASGTTSSKNDPQKPAGPANSPVTSASAADPAKKSPEEAQPLVPEASPLNFKMSPDGTVATVLFDKESIDAMRSVISQLEQNGTLGRVKGIIYASAGITPMLVLMGEKEELHQKLQILRQFIPDQNQAHIVVISASLRELMDQDAYNIGLTLSPDIIGVQLSGNVTGQFLGNQPSDSTTMGTNWNTSVTASLPYTDFSKIAQLNEAYNRGKVLVASEVYTRNGTKALLTNLQQIPIFSTDKLGNVMTQYQTLETSVDVIPTTVDYRKDNPDESQVRVDVLVKISVITGTSTFSATTTAPIYATKTFATTRILKANNARYVVGTFVNDADYKTQVGLPLLSKIPIIKWFFSRENTATQRNVAILTLAVKLLPMQQKDLTIDTLHVDPLNELLKRKGSAKDKEVK